MWRGGMARLGYLNLTLPLIWTLRVELFSTACDIACLFSFLKHASHSGGQDFLWAVACGQEEGYSGSLLDSVLHACLHLLIHASISTSLSQTGLDASACFT